MGDSQPEPMVALYLFWQVRGNRHWEPFIWKREAAWNRREGEDGVKSGERGAKLVPAS